MLDNKWIKYLEQQKQQEYAFEDANKAELVTLLLDHIGEHNAYVRDELIYPCLAHLFYDKHFNESELATYLHLLMGEEYLFFDLDDYIDYSVLVRSFSLLQLVVLVGVHNRDHVISNRSIKSLYTRFLEYFNQETVLEGYDDEVGWIHTIAHSADLFVQLMQVEHFTETEIKTMFNAITNKFETDLHYFAHNEDERVVVALKAGLDRDVLDEAFVTRWIESFATFKKPDSFPERFYMINNVKNVLRSLYFKLLQEDKYKYVTDAIVKVLDEKVQL